MHLLGYNRLQNVRLRSVFSVRYVPPNYSFNATVTCRGDNPAPGAAR